MRFAFIAEHEGQFAVTPMCRVLAVSRSGYYAWRGRQPSMRQMANEALVKKIRLIHQRSRQTYGSPRIYHELQAEGVACSQNQVARLMRQEGLAARQPRAFRRTTRRGRAQAAPNRLAGGWEPTRPDQVWVADITYIGTDEGWLYLASVMDRYSRRIVGWSMDRTLAVVLVQRAWQMALRNRRPSAALIHHSDRGSQYTARAYRQMLDSTGREICLSHALSCFDNAHQESFFGTLKTELVHHRRYATRKEARTDIFAYIEGFYNTRRRHSALGYLSPADFESAFYDRQDSDSVPVH